VRLAAEEMHDIAGAVRTSVEASLRRLRREGGCTVKCVTGYLQ
jgi:hypothetical protein